MRKLMMIAVFFTGFALNSMAQQTDSVKKFKINLREGPLSDNFKPLVIIDGNKQFVRGTNSLFNIDPQNIEAIKIWKDTAAIAKFGAEGLNGVIEIKTKKEIKSGYSDPEKSIFVPDPKITSGAIAIPGNLKSRENTNYRRFNSPVNFENSPLYIVDGIETEKAAIKNIKPDDIESINVLKNGESVLTYGEGAKNGVVIITTKKSKTLLKRTN
ncbi:TonB-dependent receptor plug domain-containing protein [Pedobacter punctiformis]|uniref:TonB-dependent receptor plug domain-containing protein n=1 Tax=Pedobacter punctiformis TaxID=3004097 RepID=A0ABT4LD85_9SPHI|nr:TonB-dependent receptor plug domain-containing protein [Pedobacter sp. HCMS5-2]MCZ4245887.1 TonB-dependent receptor plug domain-containing protein [Pedobacter sp. HCMS5-2]